MERPGELVTLSEARRLLVGAVSPSPGVRVAIADALGGTLAEPVTAPRAVPPFAASAMDGFALRSRDTGPGSVRFAVIGRSSAGRPFLGGLGVAEAVAIATGGQIPDDADAVCPVEDARVDQGFVVIDGGIESGQHVRAIGSDTAVGDVVFEAGTRIGPAHIGVLAGLGVASVAVHRGVRVGVLATGDELVEPPTVLGPGQIFDANRPALLAAVREFGEPVVDLGMVGDDPTMLRAAILDAASRCDLVLTSGGVSVGDADHCKSVLESLAADTVVWMEVRIKPGKPFGFALVGPDRVPVCCLPGNPVSALVVFEALIRPALARMSGRVTGLRRVERAIAAQAFPRVDDGKVHFVRVVASQGADGALRVRSAGGQGSHQLRALASANALAMIDDGECIDDGDPVRVMVTIPDAIRSENAVP